MTRCTFAIGVTTCRLLSHTSGHTKFVNLQWLARWHCSLVKSRTLFVIFCFRKPVGFRSQKFFFSRITLKNFFGAFHQISRLFFFLLVFFFHYYFFPSFTLRLPRMLSGTISSAPVQGRRNVKRLYGAQDPGLETLRVSFAHNQTLTHTTWLNSAN